MARTPKKGLDYSPWDVDVLLCDSEIDRLMDAQGCAGFVIYFYLCQMAYKTEGYYLKWSYADSATTAKRIGGGVRSETVKQAVSLCLQLGLFDSNLFARDGILTSRRIQETYLEARSRRIKVAVIEDYWLLEKKLEQGGLDNCGQNQNLCIQESDSCIQKSDSCMQESRKVKKSKDIFLSEPADAGTDEDSEKEAESNSQEKQSRIKTFDHEHKAFLLATYLDKKISERSPYYKCKQEAQLQKWAATFDRMNRIDKIPWDDMRDVLVFSQQDEFWRNNILSPEKFRIQFVQLEARMAAEDRRK